MLSLDQKKTATTVIGGLALVGALAGCSATATDTTTGGSTTPTTEATTPATTATGGGYADGTYTETGTYQSPGGTETIEVTITLASDVITDVKVSGKASDGQAKTYQTEFANGISAAVVGKNIDDITVDKVGGSSLTSGGFTVAVEAIKADAAA